MTNELIITSVAGVSIPYYLRFLTLTHISSLLTIAQLGIVSVYYDYDKRTHYMTWRLLVYQRGKNHLLLLLGMQSLLGGDERV